MTEREEGTEGARERLIHRERERLREINVQRVIERERD